MPQKEAVTEERLRDPEWVIFIGPEQLPAPGEFQEQSGVVDYLRGIFARPLKDLKEDWTKVTVQIQQMLEATASMAMDNFETDSVEVSLGFNGEGTLAFLAKAGMEASVCITFKRRK